MNDVTIARCNYCNDRFLSIPLIWYWLGSVVAEFKLLFKQKVSDDTAMAPLKNAAENGNPYPMTVNPASVSHPSPQKYELKEARSKEDIVSYEELGVWKDTGMYE